MTKRHNDAVREARAILASIPIFAQALCGEQGVEVQFSASAGTASTDGTRITLPALPMPTKSSELEVCEKLIDLVRLFIPHEAGHIRYSAFAPIRDMKSDLGRSLLNAIEDPRMELELIQSLRGTREQLDKGCERVAEMGFFDPLDASADPAELMSLYVLYQLRGTLREQEPFLDRAEATRPGLVEVFGERFADRLDILLATDGMNMRSTYCAAKLTNAILEVVKDEEQKTEQEKKPKPDEGKPEDGKPDAGDQAGSPQAGDASSTPDGAKQAGGGQPGGKEASDQAGSDADASQGQGAGSGKANPFTQAQADASKGCRDLGDVVSEAIGKANEQADAAQVPRTITGTVQGASEEQGAMQPQSSRPLDPLPAQMATRALKTRLRSVLQSQAMSRSHESVRGHRISNRRVHRTGQYDRRLFVHQEERKGVETVVYLLGDTSGSMQNGRIEMLSDALFATADAMHSLSGVRVGMGAFPGNRVLLPIGANPKSALSRLGLRNAGGTPMGSAMYWAARQLAGRSEQRKILMVLTDGEPENRANVEAASEALEGMGVEVFGIGIQHESVTRLFARHCVVWKLDELPGEVLGMLRGALMKPQKAA